MRCRLCHSVTQAGRRIGLLAVILLALVLAVVALTFAPPVQAIDDPDPILSASEIDYPPFCLVDADGQATGFSVELLRAALAAMGRDVTFTTGEWADVRGWLESGVVEVLPLVGRTPEREDPIYAELRHAAG